MGDERYGVIDRRRIGVGYVLGRDGLAELAKLKSLKRLYVQGCDRITKDGPTEERNLQEVPSRHGAAQRLAFAYKGEGYGRHCVCEPSTGTGQVASANQYWNLKR